VIASLVRFKSGLADDEVQAKFEARADAYERVPGLIEKLYLHYRTGEFGAIYVWEGEEALAAFRAEGGEVDTELADVTLVVRPALV
jgi:heme-degrading monooxygenase HmoA